MWAATNSAGRSKFTGLSALLSLRAGVASESSCGSPGGEAPCSNNSNVACTASTPIAASRSCSSPAVSSGLMYVHRSIRIGPASIFSTSLNTVTPDFSSPPTTAQLIGAAPRYLGSSEACRFTHPSDMVAREASPIF